jgi:hypothetical protein
MGLQHRPPLDLPRRGGKMRPKVGPGCIVVCKHLGHQERQVAVLRKPWASHVHLDQGWSQGHPPPFLDEHSGFTYVGFLAGSHIHVQPHLVAGVVLHHAATLKQARQLHQQAMTTSYTNLVVCFLCHGCTSWCGSCGVPSKGWVDMRPQESFVPKYTPPLAHHNSQCKASKCLSQNFNKVLGGPSWVPCKQQCLTKQQAKCQLESTLHQSTGLASHLASWCPSPSSELRSH